MLGIPCVPEADRRRPAGWAGAQDEDNGPFLRDTTPKPLRQKQKLALTRDKYFAGIDRSII